MAMTNTSPPKVKIQIAAWTRYESIGLSIVPSLAGAEQSFDYQGRRVTVRLPTRPPARRWNDYKGRISCSSWKVRKGRKVPLIFHVREVDVIALMNRSATVSASALDRVDSSKFGIRESRRLDKITG